MTMYVTTVNDKGSLIAFDHVPDKSRFGFVRTPGQRYQVPSVLRLTESTNDPEVIAAGVALIDGIKADIDTHGYAAIEWGVPTDVHTSRMVDGVMVQYRTKWADIKMSILDDSLEEHMVEEATDPKKGGGKGGNKTGGNKTRGAAKPQL